MGDSTNDEVHHMRPTLRYRPLREGDGEGDAAPWTVEEFEHVEGCAEGEGPAFDALSELARGGGRWLATVTSGGVWTCSLADRAEERRAARLPLPPELPRRPPSAAYVVRSGIAAPILPPECWEGDGEGIGPPLMSCRGVNAVEWWQEIDDARWLLIAPMIPPNLRVRATAAALRAESQVFSDAAWPAVDDVLTACERRAEGRYIKRDLDDYFEVTRREVLLREGDVDAPEGVPRGYLGPPRAETALGALALLLDAATEVRWEQCDPLYTSRLATGQTVFDLALAQRCNRVATDFALVMEQAPSVYARAQPGETAPDIREFYRWLAVASGEVRRVVGDAWYIARSKVKADE